jgi:sulfopyruvate decarboxylase TPP-binding subunit
MNAPVQTDWPDRLFATLKRAGVAQVGYVPDAGHARLINRCRADDDIRDVILTTEEEGVALAAGAWLGGQRCALLMQSSGVGNCVNMLSLMRTCRFPMLMFITMRGEWEANIYRASAPHEVEGVAERAAQQAFGDERIVGVLLSQKLIGKKVWTK